MEKKIKFKALSWHSSPSRVWPQSSPSLSPNLCHPSLCLCSRLKFIFIDFLLIYTFYLLIKMLTQTSSPTSFMGPSPTRHSTYRFFPLLYYSASASSDDDWHFICLASSVKCEIQRQEPCLIQSPEHLRHLQLGAYMWMHMSEFLVANNRNWQQWKYKNLTKDMQVFYRQIQYRQMLYWRALINNVNRQSNIPCSWMGRQNHKNVNQQIKIQF